MPSEAELLGAVLENVLDLVSKASNDAPARRQLEAYRSLLADPEQLHALLAEDHDEEYHGPEPPGEGWKLKGEGPRGGKIWTRGGDSKEPEKKPEAGKGGLSAKAAALFDRLPTWVTKPAKVITKAAYAIQIGANKAVQAVAKERGLSEEQVNRLAAVVATADIALGGSRSAGAATAVGLGALAAPAAFVPWGSVGYLAYSTARNPLATLRAARNGIRAVAGKLRRKKGEAPVTQHAETDDLRLLAGALAAHAGEDWFEALLFAALDESGSVEEAIRLAEAAHEELESPAGEDSEEDARDLFPEEEPAEEHAEEGEGGPDAHEPFYETGWGYRLARRYGAADRGPDR